MNILLIDDDPEDCEMLAEAIGQTESNTTCTMLHDGEQALEYLMHSEVLPSLIFLDVNMPGMNGSECLVRIKSQPTLKHLPVIIYTTTASEADEEKYLRLGASYVIKKPNTYAAIKNQVQVLLKNL